MRLYNNSENYHTYLEKETLSCMVLCYVETSFTNIMLYLGLSFSRIFILGL